MGDSKGESKYVGFHWPPKDWWFGGHWTQNHPLSHLLGGALAFGWLLMRVRAYSIDQTLGQFYDIASLALGHEYLQIEFSGPDFGNSRYPVYSALGDAIFVVLGALGFWVILALTF